MRPTLPEGQPPVFRTPVHGTVFGDRLARLAEVALGDPLILIPDPPMEDEPAVWVHLSGGDIVGHVPPEVSTWLSTWLYLRGHASATAVEVGGADVPSWKRLVIEITCTEPAGE
jgi:hypothetical protein